MNLRDSTHLVFLLSMIAVCTTVLHASELPPRAVHSHRLVVPDPTPISGTLPFASLDVSEDGTDLSTSTIFSAEENIVSGRGTDHFEPVRRLTPLGPFTLVDTEISNNGGGFMLSNPGVGTFEATGGRIVSDTPESLVVTLTGQFEPGVSFPGLAPSPARVELSFSQIDSTVSASGVINVTAIPEPGTLMTMGMGLSGTALMLRRKPRHK